MPQQLQPRAVELVCWEGPSAQTVLEFWGKTTQQLDQQQVFGDSPLPMAELA